VVRFYSLYILCRRQLTEYIFCSDRIFCNHMHVVSDGQLRVVITVFVLPISHIPDFLCVILAVDL
jgi:hypothetical protein